MVCRSGRNDEERTARAIDPISHLLTEGKCEPLKAAVHGLLLATAAVCAAYNTAAWLKRRQRHLAINAVVYTCAVLWERVRVMDHMVDCASAQPAHLPEAPASPRLVTTGKRTERDAA
jgi:hypothetical protein